jgi:formyl-CoA transferase
MERPELGVDERFATLARRKANEDALDAELNAWTQERTAAEVTHLLQAAGIAVFPTYDSCDLSSDAHLNGGELFVELDHPEVGRQRHIGIPWQMSGTPCRVQTPAPCLGEHTEKVMGELLGYSAAEIADLRNNGVLR